MDRPFPAYKGDNPYIFVSYSHSNSSLVFPELAWLKDCGFGVWYDEGIEAGTEWRDEIGKAIKGASLFLFFISPESVKSENCRKEVSFADKEHIPIVSVYLKNTDLPEGLDLTLSDRQAILKFEIPKQEYQQKLQARAASYLDQPLTKAAVKGETRNVSILLAVAVVLVLVIGLASYLQLENDVDVSLQPEVTPAIQLKDSDSPGEIATVIKSSIAVLPFVNMSNDPDNEYFSDGISEEILNTLVNTTLLTVIARTSSFQFKGKNLSVQKIAAALNASHILEGSVRKAGNTVRITAQLIDAKTGVHLWSGKYDRELVNIFALQDEISFAIVAAIQSQVGEVSLKPGTGVRTRIANGPAYDIYLRGLANANSAFGSGSSQTIAMFERAVKLDPEFTEAWIELAIAHDMSFADGKIPRDYSPKITSALHKALILEPDNALALALLGYATAVYEYRWIEGAAMMKRAVELAPNNGRVLLYNSLYLQFIGDPGAVDLAEKTYRMDPLSEIAAGWYAIALSEVGRQLDAQTVLKEFSGLKAADPRLGVITYLETGELELAQQKVEESKKRFGEEDAQTLKSEYYVAESLGDDQRMIRIEQKLLEKMESEAVTFNMWGSDATLKRRWELGFQQRQPHFVEVVRLPRHPQFSDVEWQTMRRTMNFDQLGDISDSAWAARERYATEIDLLKTDQVNVGAADLENYTGSYSAQGLGMIQFSVIGGSLWVETMDTSYVRRQLKTIALGQNKFTIEKVKEYDYTFVSGQEYDLIEVNGQLTGNYKKIEQKSNKKVVQE